MYRPALGTIGNEAEKNVAMFKPVADSVKQYAETVVWDNLPSYNKKGNRLTYMVVELSNDDLVQKFNNGVADWAEYNITIIENKNSAYRGKVQAVFVNKTAAGEKPDVFASATKRKPVVNGQEVDTKPNDYEIEGYNIAVKNKYYEVAPAKVTQASEGAKQLVISHDVEKIDEFKGTMKVAGKEVEFVATRDEASNKWTLKDKNGNDIQGVTVDASSTDNTLVLNTPELKENDYVNVVAKKAGVTSPPGNMLVKSKDAKLPTDIRQGYSDNPNNAVILAKPYMEKDANGEVIGLANPNATYTLVDENGNDVPGVAPVKVENGRIKFDVPKDKLVNGKKYSIKVSIEGKTDSFTKDITDGNYSSDGNPANAGVVIDTEAPKVTLENIITKMGDTVNKEFEITEENDPISLDKKKGPTGLDITLDNDNKKIKVDGEITAPLNDKYSVTISDKFGNTATATATIFALPKVTKSIPKGVKADKYVKVTFRKDKNSSLRETDEGSDEYTVYILKDFNEDGKPENSITLEEAKKLGLSIPNYDVNDGFVFDKWDGLGDSIDLTKDSTITLKTKFDLNSLKDPAITEVGNTSELTKEEQDKVKAAVKAANPGLDDKQIAVDDKGKVTVTVAGESKEIPAEKTVEANNTPKAPEKTKVVDPDNLTKEEQDKVKAAVKKANPNLPEGVKITVDNKGNVVIKDKDGHDIAHFDQEDTVEKAELQKLNKPEITKVDNPAELTETEKKAVEKAVKDANKDLPADATVTVNDDGSVIVKDKDGNPIGKLDPADTVAAKDVSEKPSINPVKPGAKTIAGTGVKGAKVMVTIPGHDTPVEATVGDDGTWSVNVPNNIELKENDEIKATQTETDKKPSEAASVKVKKDEASKAPTIDTPLAGASEVTGTGEPGASILVTFPAEAGQEPKTATAIVGADGKWSVQVPDGVTLKENDTVKATQTEDDKEPTEATATVKDAATGKSANPTINPVKSDAKEVTGKGVAGAKIFVKVPGHDPVEVKVGDDGSWKYPLPDDVELGDGSPIKATQVEEGKEPSDEVVAEAQKSADPVINPVKAGADRITGTGVAGAEVTVKVGGKTITATVGGDGKWSAPLPTGTQIEEGTVITATQIEDGKGVSDEASQTATSASDEFKLKDFAKTPVQNPYKLTDEEKQAVKDSIKKANPELKDSEITVDNKGKVTINKGTKTITLEPEKTIYEDPELNLNDPAKTLVKNMNNISQADKERAIAALKKVNPNLSSTATINFIANNILEVKDGNKETSFSANELFMSLSMPNITKVEDPNHLTAEEKKAVEDAIRNVNKNLPDNISIKVNDDGSVTITEDGKDIVSLTQDETVTDKAVVKKPSLTLVKNPSNLTDEEKKAVEDAIRKANPGLSPDATITVGNDGSVKITDENGNVIGEFTPSDTIISAPINLNNPVKVTVGDKNNLTPAEKMAVEDAVRRANRNLPAGATIKVANDGTVTITDNTGKLLGVIPGSKTVVEEILSGGHFYEPSPGYLNNYIPKREEPKKKEEPKKEEKAEPRRLEAFRWYVRGNEHGEFMPKKGITRAEVAQIFARALGYDKTDVGSNIVEFKDVKANAWYHDAVVKTAAAGIFKGSDVGTFMPTREITRAELIATIARFQKLDTKAGNTMNLPQNHWAIALVEAAYQEGWLDIYEKGLAKFDADGVITREEVVTILNRAFGRQADTNYIDNNASRLYNFKDVDKSLWSYYEILTAANTYVVGDGWADHSNVDSNYEIDNVKWDMPLLDNDVVEQVKFQR